MRALPRWAADVRATIRTPRPEPEPGRAAPRAMKQVADERGSSGGFAHLDLYRPSIYRMLRGSNGIEGTGVQIGLHRQIYHPRRNPAAGNRWHHWCPGPDMQL